MDYTSTTEYFNFTSTTEIYVHPAELYAKLIENLGVISFYIVVTQCVVGLIGNSASLVVWVAGTKCSTLACSTYFKFLSAVDVFTLVYRLIEVLSRPPVEASFMSSDVMRPIDSFLFLFAPQLSTWIVVCLTVERMLSLCFPLKFHTKGSGKRAKIAFVVIVLVLSALNIIRPLLCDPEALTKICADVMTLSGIYFLCVIPFVIITACNVISVVRLCLQRKIGASDNRRQLIVIKLTKLSIGAGVLQCVSIFPAMLHNIEAYHRFYFIALHLDYAGRLIFTYICDMVLYLNNAFDFLLYSFSSRDFRADFKELFCCRR